MATEDATELVGNRVLATLPMTERASLLEVFERAEPAAGTVLAQAGQAGAAAAFFPLPGAAIAVIARDPTTACRSAKAALVGAEGAVGGLFGLAEALPPAHLAVLLSGPVLRLRPDALAAAMTRSPALRDAMARAGDGLLAQMLQNVACAALHPLPQRLARWLLAAREAAVGEALPLTQATLAALLAAQRTSVTAGVRALQEAGALRTSRGRIVVTDPTALGACACGCHGALRRHLATLWADAPP